MNHASESISLPELANNLEAFLESRVDELSKTITLLEFDTAGINALQFLSEDKERAETLSESKASLLQAERLMKTIRETSGFAGLRAPIARFRQWQAVRQARKAYIEAEAAFEAPDISAERKTRIANHNHQVNIEKSRLPDINDKKAILKEEKSAINQLHNLASDAIQAARNRGWCAPDFQKQFARFVVLVKNNKIEQSLAQLQKLVFQRQPASSDYEEWKREAGNVLCKAYQQYAGMVASGSYSEIARNSIRLATPMLKKKAGEMLTAFNHPAEQWQVLSECLTDPRRLRTDALWAIYWAMYQCGQWVSSTISESDAHEDVLTGKVTAQIDRWLAGWATERLRKFGYPEMRSYMGTLEIASTTEETRLGADIGLVVDLNIGSLVCKKVALFQAKKSLSGVANIGSNAGQLAKLSRRPNTGFYLFYHQSPCRVMGPAPSVCSAHELEKQLTLLGKNIDATHLPLNVYTMGWDWASFVSFGLCNPGSQTGESFSTIEEAFTILGNGDTRNLPKYLHVISIADEPRVKELRTKIHEHYRETAKSLTKEKKHHRSLNNDGPDLGLRM
ncbi:TPA: hypothetical protein QIF24_000818 [Citrobacter koseri]|nr:hypothetical protein [Citrobacter koseri]HEO9009315.1 hypothetical protein [Citrobacter koseri]